MHTAILHAAAFTLAAVLAYAQSEVSQSVTIGPIQYRFAGGDELARIFFLKPPQSPQQLQQKTIAIRAQANINRVFPMAAAQAIAVRGAPAQIRLAEQAIDAIPWREPAYS